MKIFFGLTIFFIFCLAHGDVEDARVPYLQGVHAYQQKNWSEARRLFLRSLQVEPGNSLAFYNLGLVEYQQQNKGKALAIWRKALSLNPQFREAQKAILFTLEQMPYIPQGERGFLVNFFRSFIGWVPSFELLFINAILIFASGSLLLKYFGHRKRALFMEADLPPYPALAGLLSVLCFLFIGLNVVKWVSQAGHQATVIVSQTKLRLNPAPDGITIGEVLEGTEVTVKKRSRGWVQVVTPNKSVGWLSGSSLWGDGEVILDD